MYLLIMEESIINKLEKLSSTSIPNFLLVRPLLYNLFVIESGPACTLISHYYITGKKSSDTTFLQDSADQAIWCIQHLPYFSNTAKRLRQIRNKLAHNDHLNMNLFINTILAVTDLYNTANNASFILRFLIDQLNIISETIISGDDSISSFCPLCRSPILKESIQNMKMCNERIQPIESNTISQSLKYYKESGWKEKLKGLTIIIVEGKWVNRKGVFKSWAGTVCYIDIMDEGRKCINIDTLIQIV